MEITSPPSLIILLTAGVLVLCALAMIIMTMLLSRCRERLLRQQAMISYLQALQRFSRHSYNNFLTYYYMSMDEYGIEIHPDKKEMTSRVSRALKDHPDQDDFDLIEELSFLKLTREQAVFRGTLPVSGSRISIISPVYYLLRQAIGQEGYYREISGDREILRAVPEGGLISVSSPDFRNCRAILKKTGVDILVEGSPGEGQILVLDLARLSAQATSEML